MTKIQIATTDKEALPVNSHAMDSHEVKVQPVDARVSLVRLLAASVAILCGAVVAAGVARAFSVHLGQDQSWLLYAARQILHGVKLNGPELVETNPPFVVWFSVLPVLLGNLPLVGILDGFRCFWIGLAAVIAFWSASLFQRLYRPTQFGFWFFVLTLCIANLLVVNGEDLGQREQFTELFLLPYLLLAAFRIERRALPGKQACLIGLLAALAICLKPQHILDVCCVEVLILLRLRSLRDWFNLAWLSLSLGLVLYFCSVRLFAPTYLSEMVPLLQQTYWGFNEPWDTVLHTAKRPLVIWTASVIMYAVLRKRLKFEIFASVLLAASVGALLAYLQQHKGWHYQLICFVVFACLLVGLICSYLFEQWIGERSVRCASAVAQLSCHPALVAFVVSIMSFAYLERNIQLSGYPEPRKVILAEILSAYPRGTSISFLSVFPWEYPTVLEQGYVLGTRYLHLWMLPAIIRSEDPSTSEFMRYMSAATVADLSTLVRTTEAQDLAHWEPTVVVVDRCTLRQFCDPSKRAYFGTLIEWLQVNQEFRGQWMHYAYRRTVDGLDVYTRIR